MSKGKKVALLILSAGLIILISTFVIMRHLYLTIYADELIENVFDEIYYSEMHPLLFRFTNASTLNFRGKGIVEINEPIYRNGGVKISYSSRGHEERGYEIDISNTAAEEWIGLAIHVYYEDYEIGYYYGYHVGDKKIEFEHELYTLKSNGNGYNYFLDANEIEQFMEEKGLTYDCLREQQVAELNKYLGFWFEYNEGLSRFSLDDLGDFTIEYEY